MRKKILLVCLVILGVAGGFGVLGRERVAQAYRTWTKPAIPAAIPREAFVDSSNAPLNTPTNAPANTNAPMPVNAPSVPVSKPAVPIELNLAVPFTTQAPHANWDQPYQDACEEASAAMVHYYYAKKSFLFADAADAELKKLFAWEDATFGYNKDTDAAETARLLREYYGYARVEVRYAVTAEDIRRELRAGRPVIVPAYGKALKNPNFKNGGPLYHMLTIKGYIGDGTFITNDPGTRNGADYTYATETLMDALHDWNGGDVQNGRRAMIVVYPK